MSTFAEKALKAIEAAILNRADKSMSSMTIGGKAISQMSLKEQFDIRERLIREVNQAKSKQAFKVARTRL